MFRIRNFSGVVALALTASLCAQQAPPPGFGTRYEPKPDAPAAAPPPTPAKQSAAQPAGQPAAQPAQQPAAASPPATTASQPAPAAVSAGGLNLQNASLTEVIDILARQLKLNYILDPRVKGGVFLNTYGDIKDVNTRSLLELILRINGFGMVQVGTVARIVPLTEISKLPLTPQVNPTNIPEDERTSLNLVFLKYATVDELSKLLEPFLGEFAKMYTYTPANLLLILDSNRSMRRTMELISLFDNETFTAQRVKLFEVKNGRPSDLAKELDGVFKSISLSEKNSPIKFMGLDRINTVIAVASNPTVFDQVETWLKKLDVAVKVTAGSIDNYVYRVKYGQSQALAMGIMALYGGGMYGGMGGMYGGMGGYGGGYGGGMGGYGGGMGGYGGGMGGYGGGGYGGGMGGYGGGYGGGMGGYGGGGYAIGTPSPMATPVPGLGQGATGGMAGTMPTDLTGSYLGAAAGNVAGMRIPRVVPNPFDNSLLIQGTPQEYEGILKLLKELDVPPRQVLIDAKIYEVTLTGAFSSGVTAYLQARKTGATGAGQLPSTSRFKDSVTTSLVGSATSLSAGMLVGASRELLTFLQLQETSGRTKVVSAPSIIATDSISASINVGTEVPTLTSQAVSNVTVGGNSQFTNQISNRNSGVTLNVLARINPSGIVTLVINQEISAPIAPEPGSINSPSFSKRTVQTQVTVQDGDTIAIGGIINENTVSSSGGLPFLHRLPVIGGAFGSKSYSKDRTELIIFMTPRVIYDTNQMADASEELKQGLRKLQKIVRE